MRLTRWLDRHIPVWEMFANIAVALPPAALLMEWLAWPYWHPLILGPGIVVTMMFIRRWNRRTSPSRPAPGARGG